MARESGRPLAEVMKESPATVEIMRRHFREVPPLFIAVSAYLGYGIFSKTEEEKQTEVEAQGQDYIREELLRRYADA